MLLGCNWPYVTAAFIQLLSSMRVGHLSQQHITTLRSLKRPLPTTVAGIEPALLSVHSSTSPLQPYLNESGYHVKEMSKNTI